MDGAPAAHGRLRRTDGVALPSTERGEQRELTDYLAVLRRRWPWVLLPILAFGALAWFYSTSRPLTYEATARVLLGTTAAQDAVASRIDVNTEVASRDLGNEINLAESDTVRQEVADRLNITQDELEEIDGAITADIDSDVLNFRFRESSPQRASRVANTWAEAYVDHKREAAQASIDAIVEELERELATLRDERARIRQTIESLEDDLVRAIGQEQRATIQLRIDREASAISGELGLVDAQIEASVESITQLRLSSELAGSAQVFQTAAAPKEPINAPVSRDIAIGALLGLIVGGGIALVVDGLDRTIRSSETVERLGLTVLGEVPVAPRQLARRGLATISQTRPGSIYADGYQKVRSAVRFLTVDTDIKTILVTSPHEGDGKSTMAVNLATAYANVGTRVVLVDVDFRRPSIHDLFSAPKVPGFSDALTDDIPLDQLAVSLPSLSSTLRVLTAGTCPDDPAAFLASQAVSSTLSQIRSLADLVLLDAPPTLPVADALSITPAVDGVIVVVSAKQTKEAELVETIQSLRRVGGNVLGVVVNRAPRRKEGAYNAFGDLSTENRHRDTDSGDFVPLYPSRPQPPDDGMPQIVELGGGPRANGDNEPTNVFNQERPASTWPADEPAEYSDAAFELPGEPEADDDLVEFDGGDQPTREIPLELLAAVGAYSSEEFPESLEDEMHVDDEWSPAEESLDEVTDDDSGEAVVVFDDEDDELDLIEEDEFVDEDDLVDEDVDGDEPVEVIALNGHGPESANGASSHSDGGLADESEPTTTKVDRSEIDKLLDDLF